jgi:hypothetical protein
LIWSFILDILIDIFNILNLGISCSIKNTNNLDFFKVFMKKFFEYRFEKKVLKNMFECPINYQSLLVIYILIAYLSINDIYIQLYINIYHTYIPMWHCNLFYLIIYPHVNQCIQLCNLLTYLPNYLRIIIYLPICLLMCRLFK